MRKLLNNIVKLWYKIPRYKLKIKLQQVRVDSRSFEWYMYRQQYGFDERVLWNLSAYVDNKIRERMRLVPSENNYVTLEEFASWVRYPTSSDDLKWFYDRVCKYIDWGCPYSYWDSAKKDHLSDVEINRILKNYRKLLGKVVLSYNGYGTLSDEEIEFLYNYNNFGW